MRRRELERVGYLWQTVGRIVIRNVAAILVSLTAVCTASSTVRAADCEDLIAQHMVGEALLAAQALDHRGAGERAESFEAVAARRGIAELLERMPVAGS